MITEAELAAAIQAMMDYYTRYARYHRLWRYALAREDALRTELVLARAALDVLGERVSILEETLAEVRFGPMRYPV